MNSGSGQLFDVLEKVLSRPIAFHRIFAVIGGGATEGLFLSQAYYWSKHTKDAQGWFYKTGEEWEEETCLTRREQETARKALRKLGILEEIRKGLPRKVFYRINRDVLYQVICNQSNSNPCGSQFATNDKQVSQKRQTSRTEIASNEVRNDKQECTNQPSSNVISDELSIYTETTTETTTESGKELVCPKVVNLNLESTASLDSYKGINSAAAAPPLNQIDNSFVAGRPQNPYKQCGLSVALDPWMVTAKNPDKEFAQWVADKRYAEKSKTPLADAKAEIRNNSDRASDLWDEYQAELAVKAQRIEATNQIPQQEIRSLSRPQDQAEKYAFASDPDFQAKAAAMKARLLEREQKETVKRKPCKTP
ncbi:MAG: hypothetical protein ACKPEQ_11690 [Dolichospermum sp.]